MLLNCSDNPLFRSLAKEYPGLFGYFITRQKRGIPAVLRRNKALRYGCDNDCFLGKFTPRGFLAFLLACSPIAGRCLFFPAPDVVGDWAGTLALFPRWAWIIRLLGFPVALVLQDGARAEDVPWSEIDAVFVGGSVAWKLSPAVTPLLERAGELGKWRHVGRVNSIRRMEHFRGLAESFDGTTFAFSPNKMIKRFLPAMIGLEDASRYFVYKRCRAG